MEKLNCSLSEIHTKFIIKIRNNNLGYILRTSFNSIIIVVNKTSSLIKTILSP